MEYESAKTVFDNFMVFLVGMFCVFVFLFRFKKTDIFKVNLSSV